MNFLRHQYGTALERLVYWNIAKLCNNCSSVYLTCILNFWPVQPDPTASGQHVKNSARKICVDPTTCEYRIGRYNEILYISAMRIAFLIFDGFQLLDVSGPAAVFGAAANIMGEKCDIAIVSIGGGCITSNCGVAVNSRDLPSVTSLDSVFVVGGDTDGLDALIENQLAASWFEKQASKSERYGSICSGAFAVAAWGLAEGQRVTTHWNNVQLFQRRFPNVTLCQNEMYVEHGRLWTSAGVTAGIDMALAIVKQIYGLAVANAIAQRLVLSVQRAGFQSQFSAFLDVQAKASGRYHNVAGYISANIDQKLDIITLANIAGESPRSFHRNFSTITGYTPAQFVASVRLDQARSLLSKGISVKLTAGACGYRNAEHFSRNFFSKFGISPSLWKENNLI